MCKAMEDFKAEITAEVTKEVTKEVTEEVTKAVTAKERAKAAIEIEKAKEKAAIEAKKAKNRQLAAKMILRGTSDTDMIDIFEISAEELAELKTELGIA